jgi:hypothetical protein
LGEITSLSGEDGELRVGFAGDTAVFELGQNAVKWAEKIRNPPGLLDKLGVKPGAGVAVIGVNDAAFLGELRSRAHVVEAVADAGADFVFYAADRAEDLARLPGLSASIKRSGAIWVVTPKGKGATLKDTQIMAAAREAGLVDTKVVSFSDTHTALKLVIPAARR